MTEKSKKHSEVFDSTKLDEFIKDVNDMSTIIVPINGKDYEMAIGINDDEMYLGTQFEIFAKVERGKKPIGEILQEIYDNENHLCISWVWDGGIDVYDSWVNTDKSVRIAYHRNSPEQAIRETYKQLKLKWEKNKKKD